MNKIKNTFTIKDFENLTGIKAHTIRIWEKRYGILEPMRTDTNIRVYDSNSLQKLLNINTLNTFGYKISNIAKIPEERLPVMVSEILTKKTLNNHVLSSFKLAMMNFDQHLFFNTYNNLLATKLFRDIFYDCFMPLLEDIGNLWQTDTITPAHEHFISNLIKQKIAVNTEALQANEPLHSERVFILYLPEGEIHEIGLMLLNYELLFKGYPTVYLGESVPVNNIKAIKSNFDNITFITYITVETSSTDVYNYLTAMKNEVVNDESTRLLLFGRAAETISKSLLNNNIRSFSSIREYIDSL